MNYLNSVFKDIINEKISLKDVFDFFNATSDFQKVQIKNKLDLDINNYYYNSIIQDKDFKVLKNFDFDLESILFLFNRDLRRKVENNKTVASKELFNQIDIAKSILSYDRDFDISKILNQLIPYGNNNKVVKLVMLCAISEVLNLTDDVRENICEKIISLVFATKDNKNLRYSSELKDKKEAFVLNNTKLMILSYVEKKNPEVFKSAFEMLFSYRIKKDSNNKKEQIKRFSGEEFYLEYQKEYLNSKLKVVETRRKVKI